MRALLVGLVLAPIAMSAQQVSSSTLGTLAETALRLEPMRVDLGRFPSNRPPSASITLVNDGRRPLEGIFIRSSCGCLAAVAEGTSVPSGGRMDIRLSILPEKLDGPFSHCVFVEAGGDLLRASVIGEGVPLFKVHPENAANLGTLPCGSPFQAEFLLEATETATLGACPPSPLVVETIRMSPFAYRVLLRGTAPRKAGRFRLSAAIPIVSPAGWEPLKLSVYGRARQ